MFTKTVLAVATAAALLFPGHTFAQNNMAERLAPGRPPMLLMRAKAKDTGYPEQSLASFQWAIDRGVDVVVLGVQMTADGQYVVMRDATLPRTTNARTVFPKGAPQRDPGDTAARWHMVADYTLDEIKEVRLLDPKGGDHPVPTLDEALELIDGRILAVLKLEFYDVDSLTAMLETHSTENLLLFTWSDRAKLREISAATGIGVWDNLKNADAIVELERFSDMYGPTLKVVDVNADQILPDLVAQTTEMGVRLSLVGDVEDSALGRGNTAPWKDVLNSPVAVYSTEYPDAVLGLLDR